MADSANILSILAMLGQGSNPPPGADAPDVQLPGVANNVLQAAAPAPPPVQAPVASSEDIYRAATADAPPTQPARSRSSLLDKIGRISDVIAKVGGADPLYQPTLDARQDRVLALGDHDRKVSSENIKLATDKFDLGDKQNTRVGQAARGLKAIIAANPNVDVSQAWPVLAARMQLDPATAQSFGKIFAEHPEEIDGVIAATTDPKYSQSKYGGSVVYGTDAKGNLVAFQPSLGDDPGRNVLPDGITPVDPAKFVDTGGSMVGVGTRSNKTIKILPKTAKPDTILTTNTSRANNRDTNTTNLTIAGMPARTNVGKGAGNSGDANVPTLLDNIEQGFVDLHNMKALAGEGGSAVGTIEGAFGRSALGQKIGEQMGNPAAQKRLEVVKNISQLQQAMLKSLPASATRTRFEQEMLARGLPDPMKMDLNTARTVINQLRQSYAEAVASINKGKTAAPAAAPKKAPTSGWGTATVVHGG